jgi:hypothetical protein
MSLYNYDPGDRRIFQENRGKVELIPFLTIPTTVPRG